MSFLSLLSPRCGPGDRICYGIITEYSNRPRNILSALPSAVVRFPSSMNTKKFSSFSVLFFHTHTHVSFQPQQKLCLTGVLVNVFSLKASRYHAMSVAFGNSLINVISSDKELAQVCRSFPTDWEDRPGNQVTGQHFLPTRLRMSPRMS